MLRMIRVMAVVVVLVAFAPLAPVGAQANSDPLAGCLIDTLGKSQIALCKPVIPNGDLVIFAHGYVNPTPASEEMKIPIEQLSIPDSSLTLPGLVTSMGYAFATTSYRQNGLAVKEGVEDIAELVEYIRNLPEDVLPVQPNRIYLAGASEGGLITALALEKYPDLFSGGLSTCGPVGDMRKQVNYWGDFRVVFDYFFPDLLPPTAINIPDDLIPLWNSEDKTIQQGIGAAILSKPLATMQLLSVTGAPVDPFVPETSAETAIGILGYNINATNQGKIELGGNPFDNTRKWYRGSFNDSRLNNPAIGVKRFAADPAAIAELSQNYIPKGNIKDPIVTMHTIGDPIVPYWHEPIYTARVIMAGKGTLHANIPILRYGHCAFKPSEILFGFGVMVYKATQQPFLAYRVQEALPEPGLYEEYNQLEQQFGPDGAGHNLYLPAISQ